MTSKTTQSVDAPHVPTSVPFIGHAVAFGRDPIGFTTTCRERYGDVFVLKFPGGPRTVLVNPMDFPAYFKEKRLQSSVVVLEIGARIFGFDLEGLGPDEAKMLTHVFGAMIKGDYLQPLNRAFQERLVSRLHPYTAGSCRDTLMRWIQEHVFAAGVEAFFGHGFYSKQVFDDFTTVDRHAPLLAAGMPVGLLRGVRSARARFARATMRMYPGRSEVVQARDKALAQMGCSTREIGYHQMVWAWASQVNTLIAAFWSLLFILREQEARSAIEAEVQGVCGDTIRRGELLSNEQLRQLKRVDSAVSEALRLSAGAMMTRRATKSFGFETNAGTTYRFEEGGIVDLFPLLTHLNPEVYERPFIYRYDRFLANPKPPKFYLGGQRVAFPLLPFGAGGSMCPGRFLARDEIKIVLAVLLGLFDIEIDTHEVPALDVSRIGLSVLPPVKDVPIRIRWREA